MAMAMLSLSRAWQVALVVSSVVACCHAAPKRVPEAPPQADATWRLISISEDAPLIWAPPTLVDSLQLQLRGQQAPPSAASDRDHRSPQGSGGVGFLDVTSTAAIEQLLYAQNLQGLAWKPKEPRYPTQIRHRALVERLNAGIQQNTTAALLGKLTDFFSRYYELQVGREAALWIASTCKELAAAADRDDVTVEVFEHDWAQPSVIVKMEPAGASEDIIVFGAHLDSINLDDRSARAPGADDDGSGTIAVMELFRVLLAGGFVPKKRIHFQFYAAEEVGLWGSDAVAKAYYTSEAPIFAMMQFDMCGYDPKGDGQFRVVTDFVSESLSDFLRLMITSYTDRSFFNRPYGYGASDHASFHRVGYPASHAAESTGYPHGHSAADLPKWIDHAYLADFVKVGVGYAVELSA